MTALEYIVSLPYKPMMLNGNLPIKMSNRECKRLLDNHSILINGLTPSSSDEVVFPITELIFFPTSKRKTTLV